MVTLVRTGPVILGRLADAFNTVYGLTETRLWWKTRAFTLASGPILALAVIVAILFMLTGSRVIEGVAEVFGLRDLFSVFVAWLRYPVALLLLWVALSVIYRYSPAVRQPFRSVIWGAADTGTTAGSTPRDPGRPNRGAQGCLKSREETFRARRLRR